MGYQRKDLKLNGSRKGNMHGSIWTKNDQSGRQRVEALTPSETKKAQFRSILVLKFFVVHHAPFTFTEAPPLQLITRKPATAGVFPVVASL